jgi:hypothetical protein
MQYTFSGSANEIYNMSSAIKTATVSRRLNTNISSNHLKSKVSVSTRIDRKRDGHDHEFDYLNRGSRTCAPLSSLTGHFFRRNSSYLAKNTRSEEYSFPPICICSGVSRVK